MELLQFIKKKKSKIWAKTRIILAAFNSFTKRFSMQMHNFMLLNTFVFNVMNNRASYMQCSSIISINYELI